MSQSKTQLTIAANQGAIGGGEVMLFLIAEAARELGRDVNVVAPAQPSEVVEEAKRRGFGTVAIDGDGAAAYLRNLRRWDIKCRTGLLWCNGLRPAFATAGRPDRVVELHQRPVGKLKALATVATKGAAAVVVPSRNMAEAIPGTEVMWNWSEPVTVDRADDSDGTFTVGFLGRLSSDKGVVVLCEAMELLERRSPGRFRLLLAGESRFVEADDAARVEAAIGRLGGAVDRRGWLLREDFFADVDLAVFPSVWEEPFGLVVTEAMSAGVPFVVSTAGALAEVAGEDYPFVALADDAVDLADVIERAAVDPQQRVGASYERWRMHFSPEAGRERLADLLDRLEPEPLGEQPRVALAHDYFTQRGGAERVAVALFEAFPGAEMTTALHNPATTYPEVAGADLNLSPLNRLPWLRRDFRLGLPLFGWAFSHTEAGRGADVVIASSTAFAHGVKTDKPKIVYCHSPARFLYLVDDYLGKKWWRTPVGWGLMALRPALVRWDKRAARSADLYLCNSTVVQQRIRDVYGIEARIVHPPATLDPADPREPIPGVDEAGGHFLLVSRLMPYKNVDVAIEAFRRMPGERLLIVGRGPLKEQLGRDLPSNVTMVEGISDAQLRWAYATAAAVVAPSREDFGLTPIEGFRFGTPALALRAGGYLDTVVEGVSGWFFEEATAEGIVEAVGRLRAEPIARAAVVGHSEGFTPTAFVVGIRGAVDEALGRT